MSSTDTTTITPSKPPTLVRASAHDPSTTPSYIRSILARDGAIILTSLLTPQQASQIRADLAPSFAADGGDASGFFPSTTRRAIGLLGISPTCVELALNPLFTAVADEMLTSKFSYWVGQERCEAVSKPQISSTVGFQVNPGARQQGLHRDEIDYHHSHSFPARSRSAATGGDGDAILDSQVLLGLVLATVPTTARNGATVLIPGSHTWDDARCPLDSEAVPAELNPGDATLFLGSTYHAGGANVTEDEVRETVGIFLTRGSTCSPLFPILSFDS